MGLRIGSVHRPQLFSCRCVPCTLPIMVSARTIAVVILITTAILKLVASLGQSTDLFVIDPVLYFLNRRQLFVTSATLELIVAAMLCSSRISRAHGPVLLMLAWTFFSYRLVRWFMGFKGPCLCSGYALAQIGLTPQLQDWLMKLLLVGLLVCGCILTFCKRSANPLSATLQS